MPNLTGVPSIPSVSGDLNLAGSTLGNLSEEEQLKRKKKLMSAGQSSEFQSAASVLFGNRLGPSGNPLAQ